MSAVIVFVVILAVCAALTIIFLVVLRRSRKGRFDPNNSINNGLYFNGGMVMKNEIFEADHEEPLYEEMH